MKFLSLFKFFVTVVLFSTFINADAQTPTVYLIGDSTCSDYSASTYPRTGWGTLMYKYFDPNDVQFDNRAKSGRSSKSFYDEGAWTPVINAVKAGDFVIIQFGHNDQKDDRPELYTIPYTTYQEYLKLYIDQTRAKGAYPILATSIYRNYWNGDGVTMKDSHGDYPPAMKALATAENVPLMDAHSLSKTLFESLGKDYCTNQVFMNIAIGEYPSNYPNGRSDNTHLRENGADKLCKVFADDLSSLSQTFNYLSVFADVLALDDFIKVRKDFHVKVTFGRIEISSKNMIDKFVVNDITGREIFRKENFFKLDVHTHNWNTGLYFIQLSSLKDRFSKKVVISK